MTYLAMRSYASGQGRSVKRRLPEEAHRSSSKCRCSHQSSGTWRRFISAVHVCSLRRWCLPLKGQCRIPPSLVVVSHQNARNRWHTRMGRPTHLFKTSSASHCTSSECCAATAWTTKRCKLSTDQSCLPNCSTRPAPGGVSRRRMIDIASKLSFVVESGVVCTRLTGQQLISSSRTMTTRCSAAS